MLSRAAPHAMHNTQMREKKKLVAQLKTQLRELNMTSAVDTRYMGKERTADNEALRRLENVTLADARVELTQVLQQIDIEVIVGLVWTECAAASVSSVTQHLRDAARPP